jgi:hypothetical protein
MLLRIHWHVGHADYAAHKRRPWLLGDWLKVRKIPKLPFIHLDLGHVVVEYPSSQHGETASLGIGKHRTRQSFPHQNSSLVYVPEVRARQHSPIRGHARLKASELVGLPLPIYSAAQFVAFVLRP